jgi:hypothetical protein
MKMTDDMASSMADRTCCSVHHEAITEVIQGKTWFSASLERVDAVLL